jgi:glyoxylase-like metal-dependent hydrolase (beta-lactamase superfamily II)
MRKLLALLALNTFVTFSAGATETVRFSIFKTGTATVPLAFTPQGGNLFKSTQFNYGAFIIQHGDDYILIDAGMGTRARAEFRADMPRYMRPLTKVKNINPIIKQLPAEISQKIKTIYLTHTHWDHLSGAQDFPGACAAIAPEEKNELKHVWPSQTKNLEWCPWQWSDQEYLGFKKSLDVFGDQSVVIVPLPGHTDGSIGVLIETNHDRYFLVGDLTWNAKAMSQGKQIPRVMRWLTRIDGKQTRKTMAKVRRIKRENPDLQIIPSHDLSIHRRLGFYPKWIE